jgi:hypothetical protein
MQGGGWLAGMREGAEREASCDARAARHGSICQSPRTEGFPSPAIEASLHLWSPGDTRRSCDRDRSGGQDGRGAQEGQQEWARAVS